MRFLTTAFVLLSAVAAIYAQVPELSINASYVPSIDYEVDAIDALTEAYLLSPYEPSQRYQKFSALFEKNHPSTSGGWKIGQNCSTFYRPDDQVSYFVAINVESSDNATEDFVIRIFD